MLKKIVFYSLLSIMSFSARGQIGIVTGVTNNSSGKSLVTKNVYYAKASYTKTSGVIFNYPSGTFSTAPIVNVSLALTGALPFAVNKGYSAVVTSNSSTATTVRVNKQSGGSTSEPATGDVDVHLWAVLP